MVLSSKIRRVNILALVFTALFSVTACSSSSRPEPIRAVPYSYTPNQQYQMQQMQQNPYQVYQQNPYANPYGNMPYAQPQGLATAPPVQPMQPAPTAVRPIMPPAASDNDELYYPRYFYD